MGDVSKKRLLTMANSAGFVSHDERVVRPAIIKGGQKCHLTRLFGSVELEHRLAS